MFTIYAGTKKITQETITDKAAKVRQLLQDADAVIIGAGAGLSTAAGIEYSGARFTENFKDFIERYGLTDMYTAGFYPFQTEEEKWAYWSRHIRMLRPAAAARPGFPLPFPEKNCVRSWCRTTRSHPV